MLTSHSSSTEKQQATEFAALLSQLPNGSQLQDYVQSQTRQSVPMSEILHVMPLSNNNVHSAPIRPRVAARG